MTLSPEAIQALQGMDTAVAVLDPASWEPVFENAAFFRFFPSGGGDSESIFDRVNGLDQDKLETRMGRGRKYEFAIDVRQEPRTICLNLVFHPATEDQPFVLMEAQNVTKQREAEMMLDSYSSMSEKARRELEREVRQRICSDAGFCGFHRNGGGP